MNLVFEVAQGKSETITKRLIPLVMLTTWLTHLFGGSAGREGVAVQIGATVGHQLDQRLETKEHSRLFLVAGMAAGFAGLFQTPLAATCFALEVLVVGRLELSSLLPALLAALTASFTSHHLGLEKFSHLVELDLQLTPILVAQLLLLGLAFGLCGRLFASLLAKGKAWANRQWSSPYKRIAILGLVASLLLLVVGQGRYAGLGTNLIEAAFQGQRIEMWDWILKLLLTVLTLAAGFQGGEVTPLFAMGASLGVCLGTFFGLPLQLTAALGYASVFGAATRTLFAPMLIGAEVFGASNLPYFFIVCLVAFSCNPKKSIYSLQERTDSGSPV